MREAMNHVERFEAVMSFQPVDRLPRVEWAPWWDATIKRWHEEGLPRSLTDEFEIREYFGLDPYRRHRLSAVRPSCPRPAYHGDPVIRDEKGYDEIKQHLYPPEYPNIEEMAEWAGQQQAGQLVIWFTIEGFFWFPRILFGIEPHLYAFYDLPELMHRMNGDLANHVISIVHHLSKVCRPNFMTFAEDMSYNHGPMLSRELFYEFLAPYYRKVVPALKEMGTRVIVDTDGDCSEMVPWLMDVGVDGVLPLERQAGVDGQQLRERHDRWLMIGHYDKMVMPRGEEAMRTEFERLLPTMRSGGFIPSVDHQTPPGVSLRQYRTYRRLQDEYATLAAR